MPSELRDGLVEYILGKDFGGDKVGSVIRVDPDRKKWLDENGFSRSTVKPVRPSLKEKEGR